MSTDRSGGLVSIVLATYNWPEALRLSMQSLAGQSDRNFELVIADDGSRDDTRQLIEAMRRGFPVPILHVWQEDIGFRRALAVNNGIAAARGDYLIFMDGDCLAQPDFVARHRALAAAGHLVTGTRVMLGEKLTGELCRLGHWDRRDFMRSALKYRLTGQVNKLVGLFVKLPDTRLRDFRGFVWRAVRGCNIACWKADAEKIGGFDEAMTGWGHEDADFVLRMHQSGIVQKSGALATEVLHLWHRIADRSNEAKNAEQVRELMRRSAAPRR